MARSPVLTKEMIIEGAFSLAREKGRDALTVRAIPGELGTSTAPIYTQYENMEQILGDLTAYIRKRLMESTGVKRTRDSFLDIGVGIIAFALENRLIFSQFFLSGSSRLFDYGKSEGEFYKQMRRNPFLSILDGDRLRSLLEDMWIYTFGLAAMICTGMEEEAELSHYQSKLEKTGSRLIQYHLYSSGKLEEHLQMIYRKMEECK